MNQTHASQGSFYPGVLARVEEYVEGTFPHATRVWHVATFAVYEAAVRWLQACLRSSRIYLDPSVEDRRPDAERAHAVLEASRCSKHGRLLCNWCGTLALDGTWSERVDLEEVR